MKSSTTLLAMLLLGTSSLLRAQDLSAFYPIAHYSLINTTADQLGHHDDIELVNTPYQDTNGVFCNGIYINGINPNGSVVHTPPISALYDSSFAISMEFRIDSMPPWISPVFVCGDSWRYFGMMVSWDGGIMYILNNTSYSIPGSNVSIEDWHTATGVYNTVDSTAEFYLDGQLVGFKTEGLVRSENDNRASNTDYGSGLTFLGNLRNFRIYSSEEFLSSTKSDLKQAPGIVFPNPAHDQLFIADAEYTNWVIYNLNGSEISNGKSGSEKLVNIRHLIPGPYLLVLRNARNEIVFRQQFHKL